jgi:hypothetical protein
MRRRQNVHIYLSSPISLYYVKIQKQSTLKDKY